MRWDGLIWSLKPGLVSRAEKGNSYRGKEITLDAEQNVAEAGGAPLWHWSFSDVAELKWHMVVYRGERNLYAIQIRAASEEEVLAEMPQGRGGDDQVEALFAKSKYTRIVIPLASIRRVDKLFFAVKMKTRVHYEKDGKLKHFTFSADADPAPELFEELRREIAPHAQVEERKMELWRAIAGPVSATFFFAFCGIGMTMLATTEPGSTFAEFLPRRGPIAAAARFLGPIPVALIAVIVVGFCLALFARRLKTRPTISFWRA